MTLNGILAGIVANTRSTVTARKAARPLGGATLTAPRRFAVQRMADALRAPAIRLIAEVKRASPSRGLLAPNLDPGALARAYARGGAAAISVLTEESGFKGSLNDLAAVREAVQLPVLRKDFIVDEYQLYEAAEYGADAVLIIAAILDDPMLRDLIEKAGRLGLDPLVEVHSESDVKRALDSGATLIGINNRDLADFSVDLGTTLRLRPLLPARCTVVSESGIKTAADVARLKAAGVNAVLVGESLVTSAEPARAIGELLGLPDEEARS